MNRDDLILDVIGILCDIHNAGVSAHLTESYARIPAIIDRLRHEFRIGLPAPETTMTAKVRCECGDQYTYMIVDTDDGAEIQLDNSMMCANCAMTYSRDELPVTETCEWKEGPIPDGYFPGLALVHYINTEDGGDGYGLAYQSHDMAGVSFLCLTDGGDIPAAWFVRYIALKSGRE